MTRKPRRWRRILLVLGGLFIATVLVLLRSTGWLVSLGGRPEGGRLQRVRRSPQYIAHNRFTNQQQAPLTTASNWEMMRRQFFGKEQREPVRPVPVMRPALAQAPGLRATWLGWATVLVEIDGHRVLTDPVWSERCSPSTLVGPKRFHAPPIALAELPPIDVVVISHDHYDHLDMPVVRALAAKGTPFAVPLGIGAHLERWGVPARQIVELDWNESADVAGLHVTATPSRHYSGRNPRYNNQTLWASWVVKGPAHRFYFSGDTGYFPGFKTIGQQHGPFDLTLIKIGAYDETWESIHLDPEDAVRAHVDLGGKVMLPVHWATFNLGFHAWREPPDRAVAAARKAGITLVVPRPGQTIDLDAGAPPIEEWW
ncbi:MAG TPA: MBL fold metallo-hydrolase [Thermoanaerobaculia bacterium]|jgi:L-ascorbate metabolism protein UlaG (beta-lactamase superfamily)